MTRSWGVLMLFVVLCNGCATYRWFKPGASPEDFRRDALACLTWALQIAPEAMTPIPLGQGYTNPVQTNCTTDYAGGRSVINCTSTGGEYVPPPVMHVDQNTRARDTALLMCMYGRGWSKQKVE